MEYKNTVQFCIFIQGMLKSIAGLRFFTVTCLRVTDLKLLN